MTDRSFLPPPDYDELFVDTLLFGLKVCPTCETPKPRNSEHFGQDVSTADELNYQCRECCNVAQRGLNRKSHADQLRHRYQTDPEYRERKKASARAAKQKRRAAA